MIFAHRRADLNGESATGAADLLFLNPNWGNFGKATRTALSFAVARMFWRD